MTAVEELASHSQSIFLTASGPELALPLCDVALLLSAGCVLVNDPQLQSLC